MFLKIRNKTSGPGTTEETDEWLVSEYRRKKDPANIGRLFERYTHLVYGICLKYIGDPDQCKDAVMEIFETLFSKLADHEVHNFKSWLYSVARNHCLMEIRKKGAFDRLREKIQDDFQQGDMETEPLMHLLDEEREITDEDVHRAIKSLAPGQAECISMMYLEHLSYKEISLKTGHALNEVKSHIQNGKRNLKIYLLNHHDRKK